ncbi:hypothetical protein TNCV_2735651 [Trichonephila clavipes]|nr:hypothetical protein TNCV_2735651 [Trichonephila clavipes]
MWNRRTNQQPGHCRCIRDAGVYRRGRRSNQQPGHCRCIRDAGVYRHHGRTADFFSASFPPCVSPGCPHHESASKTNSPKISPNVTPTKRTLNFNINRTSNKRKEDSDFECPPLRKTTKRQILNLPNDSISISPNKFSLPNDSNIEEVTGSQNAIPVVTPKPPSATGSTPSGNQNSINL